MVHMKKVLNYIGLCLEPFSSSPLKIFFVGLISIKYYIQSFFILEIEKLRQEKIIPYFRRIIWGDYFFPATVIGGVCSPLNLHSILVYMSDMCTCQRHMLQPNNKTVIWGVWKIESCTMKASCFNGIYIQFQIEDFFFSCICTCIIF